MTGSQCVPLWPGPQAYIMMFFLLWNSESPIRHTFLFSNLTSMEYSMNSHSLRLTFDMIPPIVPGSSPEDLEYLAPFTIGIFPSVFTVDGPLEVSEDWPMFGYGMGIGGAGGAGVLQTSGNAGLIPPLPPCAIPRPFTNVVCPTIDSQ
jgi:hypothetical protein